MYKTENQVWKDVIGIVSQWTQSNGLSAWSVKQGHQPQIVSIESQLILVDRIASNRYGWQADKTHYDSTKDQMENRVCYLTDMIFQLSFFKRRNPEKDTLSTLTSSDVANSLLTYLMSRAGLSAFRALGYGLLRTTELREPVFSDDNDSYQRYPNFDITLNFPQILATDIGAIKSENDVIPTIIKGF